MLSCVLFAGVLLVLWVSAIVDAVCAPGCPHRQTYARVLWAVGIGVTGPMGALVYAAVGRPGAWLRLVVLALCVFGVATTVPELYRMSAIRGWVPGARAEVHRVTQKLIQPGEYGDVYWIGWTAQDI